MGQSDNFHVRRYYDYLGNDGKMIKMMMMMTTTVMRMVVLMLLLMVMVTVLIMMMVIMCLLWVCTSARRPERL
jgi:hypothetical protein